MVGLKKAKGISFMHTIKSVAVGVYLGIAAIGLTTIPAHNAHAELMAEDLPELAGPDTFITRDTASGLDWLDVRLTTAISFNDITGGAAISNFSALNGLNPVTGFANPFRHATRDELLTLFANALIPDANTDPAFTEAKFTPVFALMDLLGGRTECHSNDTQLPCELESVIGVYDGIFNPDFHFVSLLSTCLSTTNFVCNSDTRDRAGPFQLGRASAGLVFFGNDTAIGGTGHFLVRDALSITAIPQLSNISTRGLVQTGDNVQIGGFIIGGTEPKTVLVRARGPVLTDFGVPGVLDDPVLQLFSGQTVIADNDNWETTSTLCQNSVLNCGDGAAITATGLDPCVGNLTGCAREAALLVTLDPGPYTAIVSGVGGGTGVGLVEVFEVGTTTNSRLTNISTRGPVGTGDDVMIGGFIIGGTEPKTVLIRARGPVLTDFGVPGELADPFLQLFSGQTVIAQNDDWQVTDPLCGSPAVSCGGGRQRSRRRV